MAGALTLESNGPGHFTVYLTGERVGFVLRLPGAPHQPREWAAIDRTDAVAGRARTAQAAAELLAGRA
jgi:hypothetical protein